VPIVLCPPFVKADCCRYGSNNKELV